MPSSYTQNLGIEQPATGEQAGSWGVTANTSYATIDTSISGVLSIPLSSPSPFPLSVGQGGTAQNGSYPLIAWTGSLSGQGNVTIGPNTVQRIYIMRNQTGGGFGIAFAQGSGAQFVLNSGCDAIIYATGGGPGAGVFAALANPQFANLTVTSNATLATLTVSGLLTVGGNLSVTGTLNVAGAGGYFVSLGVGGPSLVPDPLTINGVGTGGVGQLRLVEGNYGVIFRNDATSLYLLVTNAGDPYGLQKLGAFQVDLATGAMGIGAAASGSYALTTAVLHASSVVVDGNVGVGGTLTSGALMSGSLTVTGAAAIGGNASVSGTLTVSGALTANGLTNNGNLTNSGVVFTAGFHATGNIQVDGLLTCTANLQCDGTVNCTGTGYQFPDGTVQTTAAVATPPFSLTPYYPSRNTNTVYTNTQGKVMFVSIMLNQFAGTVTSVVIGTGGATRTIGQTTYGDGQYANFFFPVPPGYTWQLTNSYNSYAAFVINTVVEWY